MRTRAYRLVVRSGDNTDAQPIVQRAIEWLAGEVGYAGEVELIDETGQALSLAPARTGPRRLE